MRFSGGHSSSLVRADRQQYAGGVFPWAEPGSGTTQQPMAEELRATFAHQPTGRTEGGEKSSVDGEARGHPKPDEGDAVPSTMADILAYGDDDRYVSAFADRRGSRASTMSLPQQFALGDLSGWVGSPSAAIFSTPTQQLHELSQSHWYLFCFGLFLICGVLLDWFKARNLKIAISSAHYQLNLDGDGASKTPRKSDFVGLVSIHILYWIRGQGDDVRVVGVSVWVPVDPIWCLGFVFLLWETATERKWTTGADGDACEWTMGSRRRSTGCNTLGAIAGSSLNA